MVAPALPAQDAPRIGQIRPYGALYPVSKIQGHFLTIQAAIEAAFTDGYGLGGLGPALVEVYDGIYTEDLALRSGIDVRGVSPFEGRVGPAADRVVISGVVTFATADVTGTAANTVILEGLTIKPELGFPVGPFKTAITFSGANPQLLACRNCSISGNNGELGGNAINMTNSGGGSRVDVQNCGIFQRGADKTDPTVFVQDGTFIALETKIDAPVDNTNNAVVAGATGGTFVLLEQVNVTGIVAQTPGNTRDHTISRCSLEAVGDACVVTGDGGTVTIVDSELQRSDAGPCIRGVVDVNPAVVRWADLTFTSLGYGFDEGLARTQISEISANRTLRTVTTSSGTITDTAANDIRRIDITSAGAAVSVTLPSVALVAGGAPYEALRGTVVEIKEVSGVAGATLAFPLTVAGAGGNLIDGLVSYSFTSHRESAKFISTGTGWLVVGCCYADKLTLSTGAAKIVAFTARVNEIVKYDASGGPFVIGGPVGTPAHGQEFGVKEDAGSALPVTVSSGGATGIQDPITGVRAATAILTVANAGVVWQYDSASGDFVTV